MPWVRDPDAGGVKIPEAVKRRVKERILQHAEKYASNFTRLDVRFRRQFCYVDAYEEPCAPQDWPPTDAHETREEHIERLRNTPIRLFRLRYFGDEERWAFAFFGYSHETYELCILPSGDFYGTPEEAVDAAAQSYWS